MEKFAGECKKKYLYITCITGTYFSSTWLHLKVAALDKRLVNGMVMPNCNVEVHVPIDKSWYAQSLIEPRVT